MILFYVQHLLGIGHLRRTLAIANACDQNGLEVCVISGGPAFDLGPFSHLPIHQLPPIQSADLRFSALVDEHGQPVNAALESERADQVIKIFHRVSPRIVVTELFPFGRRRFRFEIEPLLDQAQKQGAKIICSVRDCVQQRSEEREAETLSFLQRYYDGVLVHGEKDFLPFDASFRRALEVDDLSYTGFVDTAMATVPGGLSSSPEVLVAAGGGAAGEVLYEAVANARRLTRHHEVRWRMLVGVNPSESLVQALRDTGGDGLVVESNRNDYRGLMATCRLSVSQAGYNSAVDILSSGAPAILVPFTGEGGETEQPVRASRLAERGRVSLINESDLGAQHLAETIDRLLDEGPPRFDPVCCDGATRSAEMLKNLIH